MEKAAFAAGCFWGVEDSFRKIKGVQDAVSGYAGGTKKNPTYEDVCSGTTGHAETVEVTFDPAQVSYEDLLKHFWKMHNPTTRNRQGPDVGTQYRSAIFYHTPEQRAEAESVITELEAQHLWRNPVVTEILPAPAFYPAPAYHDDYYANNPLTSYCQVVVAPKVAKVRHAFMEKLAVP